MTDHHSGDTTNGSTPTSALTASGDGSEEYENISRDPGTPTGLGAVAGGGYRGKRKDQDKAVQELARRLNDEFDHEITVRFNTNRLSGGAWLVDGDRDAQVGLGVNLKPPQWFLDEQNEWLHGDGEKPNLHDISLDERQLVTTVKVSVPAIDEDVANRMTDREDRQSRVVHLEDDVEAAWEWFVEHVNRDAINPPQ